MDTNKQYRSIIKELKSLSSPKDKEGMARFGINPENSFGVSIYKLMPIVERVGKNHSLSLKLWKSGIREARILAGFIDVPEKVTERQMEKWVKDFNSWDVCDQVCSKLFDRTAFAYKKAFEWSKREEEFVKRAGFVLMATLSVHDKDANDKKFEKFFPVIKRESHDDRNYVKKAVNWALRQIGKRNKKLNKKAIIIGKQIKKLDSKATRWIANDALRELMSENVQKRFGN